FRAMIQELQMCKDDFEEMLVIHLKQIFIKLHRYFQTISKVDNSQIAEAIDKATIYFADHYNENICIEDYAKMHHMSTSWFIRNFKQYTNSTPMQYILSIRIQNAEALLQNEQYNVSEISNIIGYDNPLYFSRIFKKIKGISPREYRKNIST
ncbi:MAG: helix-turn-helix transcriptional regulator, partial [Lachnospiraceae bacterium]|nr:helix-turn-helix transcriptional regulator [Lachnospiraceae bacterium]